MAIPVNHSGQTLQPLYLGWGMDQGLVEVAELITTQVQLFLGLDRVAVYQFDAEANGQVIAEACNENRLPTLKGLHFPGSDIPPPARKLLLKSRQRIIVDVIARHKILSTTHESESEPYLAHGDMRYSPVDPCHLQYLLGMGVLSSITFSIVHQGKLWGLLVGHHSDSHPFSEAEIQTVQLWVDQLSVVLAQDLLREQVQQHQKQQNLLNKLTLLMGQEQLTANCWQKVLSILAEGLAADGCRLYMLPGSLDDHQAVYTYGVQPTIDLEIGELWTEFCSALEPISDPFAIAASETEYRQILTSTVRRWEQHPQGQLLTQVLQPAGIGAVLVTPIHWQDEVMGYLSFYRQEDLLEITWAGHHSNDPRNYLPRASLQIWQEQRHEVRPWQISDLELARLAGRHLYMGLMQHWVKTRINLRSAHDVMTHLPNWLLFNKQLHLSLLQCFRQGKALAVAILNLEQFKRINTAFGHTFGNYLLQAVANRLIEGLHSDLHNPAEPELAMLARWHGDKFALLLPANSGKEEVCHHAQKLLDRLRQPFMLQGEEIYLNASMGIAIAPYDGNTPDTLVQRAEAAMYQAKRQGHGSYLVYSPIAGTTNSLSHQRLANDLYRALTQQELLLYFQPQADLHTGAVTGVEALVRWQHPQLGLVSPDQFIPIAEEMGLISQLDEWVLRTACWQYQQWRQAGLPSLQIAINVSATQFESSRLVQLVEELLRDTNMQPCELELEITEETVTRDIQRAVATLKQLKDLGIKIALDDFGTGYSSLNILKHFPVDTLKIDKSFVRNCPKNLQDSAIVQTIVALGHGLNLRVVAEGVETVEQLTWLQELQCDRLQGYFLSRPQPASAMAQWLWTQPTAPPCCPSTNLLRPEALALAPSLGEARAVPTASVPVSDGSTLAAGSVAAQSLPPLLTVSSMTTVLQPNRMHHQLQQEQLIRSITEKIRQSLHIEDILHTIVEEVRHLLDTDRVLLYHFSENWEGQVVQESVSPEYPALLGLQIEDKCFPETYVKYYRQGRVRAIADIQTADIADCHRDMLQGLNVKANLIMPVAYQDQLWGLLIAHHCRSTRLWQQEELELLGQLAVQSAIAIHQGELYRQLELTNRELQKLSTQDRLTQLANRRCFDQQLREEWQRLLRSQEPLSLILCDIDYFKQYNDTYGHPAGDLCLQQVAKMMQAAVQRPGDLVARYGGEEFVILLPATPLTGARRVAEHIQQAITSLKLAHKGSPLQQITLSLGIATQVPQVGFTPEALIQRADERLYRAKTAGRNCINAEE